MSHTEVAGQSKATKFPRDESVYLMKGRAWAAIKPAAGTFEPGIKKRALSCFVFICCCAILLAELWGHMFLLCHFYII